MWIVRMLTLQRPLGDLDRQITKFKGLAEEMKNENRRYYGDYLSRMLFDDAE